MKVNRLSDVSKYEPPSHFDCAALRLQGWDASDSSNFWVGLSHFLPGGGTTHEATPLEKVYVVVRGEVTVITDDAELTQARLWLAEATRIGLANALGLLGVSAPPEMARLDDDADDPEAADPTAT